MKLYSPKTFKPFMHFVQISAIPQWKKCKKKMPEGLKNVLT